MASLIKAAKKSQHLDERTDATMNRIGKALAGFAREDGAKIV